MSEYATNEETWQTVCIFSNHNSKMFYCEIMVSTGFQQCIAYIFLNMDCQYNRKLALACGLVSIPSRLTFDRRLKTISTDIKQRISTMGYLFAAERLVMVDEIQSITAIDMDSDESKG